MRIVLLLLFSCSICFSQNLDLNQLRTSFLNADKGQKQCNALINQSEKWIDSNDIAKAYHAVAFMINSQFKVNPISKWNSFKYGKNKLEELIAIDNSNLEIRFLRYCIQKKAPSFLNYKDKIEEDERFLLSLDNTNTDLLNFITPIISRLKDE